jgi:hypothetical protein
MNRRRALQSMEQKQGPAVMPRPENKTALMGPAMPFEDNSADLTGQDEQGPQNLQDAPAHKICDVGSGNFAAAAAADAEAPERKRVKRAPAHLADASFARPRS